MTTSEWKWYLERFDDDDELIEECEVPAGIALELLHAAKRCSPYLRATSSRRTCFYRP